MYFQTNKQFIKMLSNISNMIDKVVAFSEEKKISPEVILNSRLAPDQFSFIKQVQVCCDSAKLTMFRFTEKSAPKNEDVEKTVDELKARIQSTIDYLNTITEDDFIGIEERKISYPFAFAKDKYVTAEEALIEFSVPNFYFHVTTAYAILRHNGMNVGKIDYIGSLPFKDL